MASTSATMLATPLFEDIEHTTSLLMAQLGVEDETELYELATEASGLEDEFSSEEYAIRLQAQELKDMLQMIEDHQLALSFDQGLEANYPTFHILDPVTNPPTAYIQPIDIVRVPLPTEAEEYEEREDHEEYEEYEEYGEYEPDEDPDYPPTRPESPPLISLQASPVLFVRVMELIVEDDLSDMYTPGLDFLERSTYTTAPFAHRLFDEDEGLQPLEPYVEPITQNRCVICEDEFTEESVLRAPCEHYYCKECVVDFVAASTRDESVFPPKCCDQQIPPRSIYPFLSLDDQLLFVRKAREYGIPVSERIYCPTADCSAFLGSSEYITGDITCTKCNARVCVLCKQTAHPGDSCSENVVAQDVRALARREGWQTCPECSAVIELYQGCFHMTCRCSAQFCYLCAAPWKTCTCPQWEENRL